jgi:hypothetical protein
MIGSSFSIEYRNSCTPSKPVYPSKFGLQNFNEDRIIEKN